MSDPEMTTIGMYPEPEPVAWFCKLPDNKISIKIVGKPTEGNWEPLYAAPHKKEWVDLTDDEINILFKNSLKSVPAGVIWNISRTIEAKLKGKNT